jgi:hypothetical protein
LTFCASGPSVQAQDKTSGNIGPDAPKWMFDLYSAYPESNFLAVVGEGDTRREAENDAAGALSKIFMSKISVETTAVLRYKELESAGNSTAETQKSIDKKVSVGSDQSLFNISYGDTYTDKVGKTHIVGYLNRKDTAKIYKDKIEKNGDRVASFVKNMKASESVIRQYAFIDAAVLFAKNNEALLEQLGIIYQPMIKMIDLPYDLDELTKLYSEIAGKMTFSVTIKNDSDDKIAKMTGHILNEKGFTVAQGQAALSVTGEVLIEDTKLENKYQNVRWSLLLEMRDEKSQVLVSFNKNQRESAISKPEAIALSYRDMEKQINDEFIGQFIKYLDNIILK